MERSIFFATVLLAIVNGLISPAIFYAVALAPIWLPSFVQPSPGALFYGASLIVSSLTLILSGVPAALYERATGAGQSTPTSMGIWLAGAALLTLPGFLPLL